MSEITLQFLHNEADEEEGLGHAGIETFKDAPYASVARECGQNSSDARLTETVVMNFDLVEIRADDVPAINDFRAAVRSCLEKSRHIDEEKDIDFFEQADRLLHSETIKLLRIADFNTKGLRGPSRPGYPFHSLVKATGVTTKEDPTAGGSFGIGKNAVFAISDLQTVFYSTAYQDEAGDQCFLAQGKSILVSHVDAQGTARRATGYWGAANYEPWGSATDSPNWLRRNERGTSIFALGFRESAGWQYRMAASLLCNFFVAIHRREMEFSLNDGEIAIDAYTLPQLFTHREILKAAEDGSQLEDFEYAGLLYECLTSEESSRHVLTVPGFGEAKLHILIRDDLPKRLSIIRNGMVITDSLEKFGDKFVSFRMYRDFVAIVEPLQASGSALIKRLENPQHNGLSAERIPDEQKRLEATRTMRRLAREIRSAIRQETLEEPEDVQSIDELATFFADADESEHMPDPDSDDDPENYVYTPAVQRRRRPRAPEVRDGDDDGGASDDTKGKGGKVGGTGRGSGRGNGGTAGRRPAPSIALEDCRNVVAPNGEGTHRTVWFTPTGDGPIELVVFSAGINSSDVMDVTGSSIGEVVNGRVHMNAVAGQRQKVELTLLEEYVGPLEMIATVAAEEGVVDED